MQYTKEELKLILDKHTLWLTDKTTGERANLHRANLYRANLTGASPYLPPKYSAAS